MRNRRRRKKNSTGKVYVAVVMLFMIAVMALQIFNLYNKNQQYKKTEEALESELEDAKNKQENLKDYEQYVGSDEYIEDEASQKLGLTYDNWIIFREESD